MISTRWHSLPGVNEVHTLNVWELLNFSLHVALTVITFQGIRQSSMFMYVFSCNWYFKSPILKFQFYRPRSRAIIELVATVRPFVCLSKLSCLNLADAVDWLLIWKWNCLYISKMNVRAWGIPNRSGHYFMDGSRRNLKIACTHILQLEWFLTIIS